MRYSFVKLKKNKQKVRVLQLIDSLRPGGAEKMAVNYANALVGLMQGSYLCCSRTEGMLKESLMPEVEYFFLKKKSSLDLTAILKLRKFIKSRKISIVHAHSTSFFLAGLLKFTGLKFKLVWHDHYGESDLLNERNFKVLKIFSHLFSGIISVNTKLKNWAVQHLECNNVLEINNFTPQSTSELNSGVKLKGKEEEFKIICVANLRAQKDHFNLINAFESLSVNPLLSLHLIGENPDTQYSNSILKSIKDSLLKKNIYYYGAQTEILSLLQQANLGVLSSRSEGLPVALLEYGIAGLPVICTDVGNCAEVIGQNGKIVEASDSKALADGIWFYLENKEKMKLDAEKFRDNVMENYSQQAVIKEVLKFYGNLEQ